MSTYPDRHFHRKVLNASWMLLAIISFLSISIGLTSVEGKHSWESPGCHRVGNTRRISIPSCLEFTVVTMACRGYCESFSGPSSLSKLVSNPLQEITSVGQCCNIMETEDIPYAVMCVDGPREVVIKSAITCRCYHCKKD